MPDRRIQDEMHYCERCGISFLWSLEEQKYAADLPGSWSSLFPGSGGSAAPPVFCTGCRLLLPASGRERGLVKWYSMRKRYGFIVRRDKPDIFVPAASLEGTHVLQSGDLVEFRVGFNEQGPIADAVTLVMAATATDLAQTEDQQAPRRNPAARRSRF